MNIKWNYNPEDYGKSFLIAPGNYRVRIETVEETTSRSGRDMLKITLKVNGYKQKLIHNLVFLEENPELTNRNIGDIFESFGITPGDFELSHWENKDGAAEIFNKVDNNGDMRNNVKKFIPRSKQGLLPAWTDEQPPVQAPVNPEMIEPDAEIPF